MRKTLATLLAAWIALFTVSLPADALSPAARRLLLTASGVTLNFAAGLYNLAGATGPLVIARASVKNCADNSGNWVQVASGVICQTNQGALIEEARTNSLRNNTFAGAVVGTARTISGLSTLSRTASVTAVLLCSTCNAAVGDLITVSGANVSTYNGTWLVSAAVANTSISFKTVTNTTDSATGETVSAVSPGTLPTNWTTSGTANGLGFSVASLGTSNGLSTITITYAGAPTATTNYFTLMETTSGAAATYGQTWSVSEFIQSNSLTGQSSVQLGGESLTSGGAFITFGIALSTLTLTGSLARYATSGTPISPTLGFLQPVLDIVMVSGTPISGSLTFAAPQLELNPQIPGTVTAATTAGGSTGSGCTSGAGQTFTLAGGVGTAATLTATVTTGSISGSIVMTNVGAYSTVPPSPITLTPTGSTTCSGNPTVVPTLGSFASSGFATSPILTSGSAVLRAADQDYINIKPMLSILAQAIPEGTIAIASPVVVHTFGELDDGTLNNRLYIFRTNQGLKGGNVLASSETDATPTATWAVNVSHKASVFATNSLLSTVYDNGTPGTAAISGHGTFSRMTIGWDGVGNWCNCYLAKLAASPTSLLSQ